MRQGNGSNLCIFDGDGSALARALGDDTCVEGRRHFIERQTAPSEILHKHGRNGLWQPQLAPSLW